ncbi:trypsin-like serine protease [Streptomyces ipomoeae]|uniref:trypsin-like serine protease n=1 Tax=Streptomyces ipomoeae TaxID=103232 RepID=UPI00114746B2|nr:trypsin-like serine protease [Streptomyces ipomoeae]TQE35666.1 trypsin-like serine protease [Streptomyces ipomoeae]
MIRALKALPAATLALALSGAVLAAQPAAAADASDRPTVSLDQPAAPKASAKELRDRVIKAAEDQASPATGSSVEDTENTENTTENTTEESTEDSTEESAEGSTTPSPFIIGGSETAISTAPWMVQLAYYNADTDTGYFCGGTLVAPNKVLTAAHCTKDLDWVRHGAVLAGTTDLYDDSTGSVAGVLRQWEHPKWDADTIRNDVAVLTLDRPLPQKWLPLAASDDSALYTVGTSATAYGWGLTSGAEDAQLSAKLKKATLPLVKDSTCNSAMQSVLGKDYFAEGSMVCAGTPASGGDEGTTTTCSGDSGGPLVVGGKVVGIVSWGVSGCVAKGAYPVFTKVSSYTWAAQPRIDDTDLTYDGRADLLARTPSGNLFLQKSDGTSLAQREYQGNGWQNASWGMQADLDRDFYQDLIIRDRNDGKLYRSYMSHSTWEWTWMQISSVWGGYKSYAIPGDLTGDARPDLLALDADGSVYLYPGKGNGQFNSKIRVVNKAWKGAKLLGRGDLSGDGKPDLLVRASDGTLYLYRGTGKASSPWSPRIKARTGWKFTAYVTDGDVTGDAIADVITRDSGGTLWLYPGTNKASTSLFGSRVKLGTGYNQYNALF